MRLLSIASNLLATLAVLAATSCQGDRGRLGSTGSAADQVDKLIVDGSSTVYPIVSAMGDDFAKHHGRITLTINKSGTGSGMQKFCRGEIDIAAASRPIEPKEIESLREARIEFLEVPFAYDGVTVIVSLKNSWADRMTLSELRSAWGPRSTVRFWSDIRPGWPAERVQFYGPTDNHGTYDYFSEAINQSPGAIRGDIQTNQEYNAIVQAVADDRYGIGYVGLNYFADNRDKVKSVAIDNGEGPVSPSAESISSGGYDLLSRPLFLYVNKRSYDKKPTVREFVRFVLSPQGSMEVSEAHYVELPEDLVGAIQRRVDLERTGSLFSNSVSGLTLSYLLKREREAG